MAWSDEARRAAAEARRRNAASRGQRHSLLTTRPSQMETGGFIKQISRKQMAARLKAARGIVRNLSTSPSERARLAGYRAASDFARREQYYTAERQRLGNGTMFRKLLKGFEKK